MVNGVRYIGLISHKFFPLLNFYSMKWKLINDNKPKIYALILDSGDDVTSSLQSLAKDKQLSAAQFTAIGAFSGVTLGFFSFQTKDYKKIEINEQVEVLVLTGDISLYKNEPKLHAHVVIGKEDGTAHGGHLIKAKTHPTLEIIITESPSYLKREMDEETGLALIAIDQSH
jgi:predicted DNA-binding protein with PD1-like motif